MAHADRPAALLPRPPDATSHFGEHLPTYKPKPLPPSTARPASTRRGRRAALDAQLPHAARQVAHPLDLRRQPADDDAVARRRAVLDERQGRRRRSGISDNDWVEVYNDHGVVVHAGRASARASRAGICIHLPLARAHARRAEVAAARQPARRRPQQPDARPAQAEPDGRRLRRSSPTTSTTGGRIGFNRDTHVRRARSWTRLAMVSARRSTIMDVRSQISMVFHLDKCIGCHTCSDRLQEHLDRPQGRRVHVVEQRRDQARHRLSDAVGGPGARTRAAGSERRRRRCSSSPRARRRTLVEHLPQPAPCRASTTTTSRGPTTTRTCSTRPRATTSRRRGPISMVTGKPIDIEAGPNWDDDLGGSPVYAANDPNLDGADAEQQRAACSSSSGSSFFYLPRICNHCLNPAASRPARRARSTSAARTASS